MSEFCREHVKTVMGLDPDSELGKAWTTEGLREECGYDWQKG